MSKERRIEFVSVSDVEFVAVSDVEFVAHMNQDHSCEIEQVCGLVHLASLFTLHIKDHDYGGVSHSHFHHGDVLLQPESLSVKTCDSTGSENEQDTKEGEGKEPGQMELISPNSEIRTAIEENRKERMVKAEQRVIEELDRVAKNMPEDTYIEFVGTLIKSLELRLEGAESDRENRDRI